MRPLLCTTLIAAALALPVAVQATPGAQPQSAATLSPQTARAQGMWIDVRTPQEFRSGHLQGAINIPVQHIRAGIAAASPDKNAPLNLYCRSGRRVEAAIQELKAMAVPTSSTMAAMKICSGRGCVKPAFKSALVGRLWSC